MSAGKAAAPGKGGAPGKLAGELRTLDGDVALADLSHALVPLVRAWNRGGSGGVPMTVDATLALLRRLGVLAAPGEPELVLRPAPHDGDTCDWGHCYGVPVALRWSEDDRAYLPVCPECAVAVD